MRYTCTLLLLIAASSVHGDHHSQSVDTWVETHVPQMMREAKMPGFAIAVVQSGNTIYADAFGARDPASNLPATTDTLFGIGSITKSFVALAILQLAEQGKLSVDDPVSKHLPFELGRPDEPILIRHLLTHSPGFPSLASSTVLLMRGLGEDTGVPMSSADDFFRFVNAAMDEVTYSPGERFFYNNAAWRMLGAIVQETSGIPFHDYVTEYVIRPLGMERSTFDTDRMFADPDHLTPHRRSEDKVEPAPFPYPNPKINPEFSFLSAAGGITSSVTEMTLYLNMLIEQGRYPHGELISRRSMREMQTLQIREPDGYYGETGYGFGLGVTPDFLGDKMLDHGGSIIVSTAYMAFVPEEKIGVIMMGNSGGMNYSLIGDAVLAILLGKDPAIAVPGIVIRERMQQREGTYAVYRSLDTIDIVSEGGMLYLLSPRYGEKTPLLPTDPTYQSPHFYTLSNGRKTPIEFRSHDDGRQSVLVGRYIYHKQP